MSVGEYYENLWKQIPAGLSPPYLHRRVAYLAQHIKPGERVLDVGCAEGQFALELTRAGAQVIGIDVAGEPLRRAGIEHPGLDLRLVSDDPWPFADCSFDALWAGEVIEHVADTARWLSEVRRVLRSGGKLLLSTPDHGRLAMLGLALRAGGFARHFDPRSDHLRFYTRHSLTALLEDFGFCQIEVKGTGGFPGARHLLLANAQRARFVSKTK